MSTHTPGPWKLDIYEEQNGDKHYFFKQDDKGEEDIIFNASCPGLRAEDAHLIAAAPAMYEALKASLLAIPDGMTSNTSPICQQIRAALAQAEGSKP